ncbi:MAG: hypothetical protein US90_C0008G0003 [Candidatus Shapirobacteria bacterium GW2011_GWE2_38_30]|uniref:Uncharacterized protein n=1 Tax=Candidatus Shapirobacteria bacterium GW2011_GWE2_38_30 TaxID=1618490 RepID=A0A0G0MZ04_9BACT|nr:MAG: hypothetical protein US90_C0008G0003 [Candidatus Shapirobacteria bacterium GW2011_GWE2_38_30]
MVRYLARVNELIIYDWKFNGGQVLCLPFEV